MKEPIPEFAPPLCVYLAFLVTAVVGGGAMSCSGGLDLYALLGLGSVPVLLGCPYFVSKTRGPLIKFVMGIFYLLLGIAVWAGSFLLGGMSFMCKLF